MGGGHSKHVSPTFKPLSKAFPFVSNTSLVAGNWSFLVLLVPVNNCKTEELGLIVLLLRNLKSRAKKLCT